MLGAWVSPAWCTQRPGGPPRRVCRPPASPELEPVADPLHAVAVGHDIGRAPTEPLIEGPGAPIVRLGQKTGGVRARRSHVTHEPVHQHGPTPSPSEVGRAHVRTTFLMPTTHAALLMKKKDDIQY